MPKEITHDESGNFDVVVGWHPAGDAQLGIQISGQRALVSQLYGDPENLIKLGRMLEEHFIASVGPSPISSRQEADAWYSERGRRLLDLVESSSQGINGDVVNGGYDSVWATLTRDGCNRVIRNLRKARDAAFGRDE